MVGSREEALEAIKKMNFPGIPIQVLSYPLGRFPWSSPKFERLVATEKKLLVAVDEAIQASTIQKAVLIGWPDYSNVKPIGGTNADL